MRDPGEIVRGYAGIGTLFVAVLKTAAKVR
jgi:hypothetical protein